jgi:hypothetical protein
MRGPYRFIRTKSIVGFLDSPGNKDQEMEGCLGNKMPAIGVRRHLMADKGK